MYGEQIFPGYGRSGCVPMGRGAGVQSAADFFALDISINIAARRKESSATSTICTDMGVKAFRAKIEKAGLSHTWIVWRRANCAIAAQRL